MIRIRNVLDKLDAIEEIVKNEDTFCLFEDKKELYTRILKFHNTSVKNMDIFNNELKFKEIQKHSKIPKSRLGEVEYIAESMVSQEDTLAVENVTEIMKYLNSVEQPDQRTSEWFNYRHGVVTASSASHIFGTDSEYNNYVEEKVLPMKTFKAGIACLHGIKFEDTAQKIYEHITNTKVGEYGCIRHKTIHHLGASPDGIVIECDDPKLAGRMLEIKCLYSRKLTGIPLYKYWVQCQLQMEVCNLEYCDFFECKIDETLSDTEFYEVIDKNAANFYGLMIEYTDTDNGEKIMYKYAKMNESEAYYKIWLEKTIDDLLENPNIQITKQCFWKLKKYCKTIIKRNRDWFSKIKPEIDSFWRNVEEKRMIVKADPEKAKEIFPEKTRKRKIDDKPEVCLIENSQEDEDPFSIHD